MAGIGIINREQDLGMSLTDGEKAKHDTEQTNKVFFQHVRAEFHWVGFDQKLVGYAGVGCAKNKHQKEFFIVLSMFLFSTANCLNKRLVCRRTLS